MKAKDIWIDNHLWVENNLKKIRVEHHLTQIELANKVGVSKNTISGIEVGAFSPRLTTALSIAFVLDVPLRDIFTLYYKYN